MTTGSERIDAQYHPNGSSPVALAARWFGAAEEEINGGGDIVDPETWQAMLDRIETVAKVDPTVLLEVARIQQVDESYGPDERFLAMGSIVQLALMNRHLDNRAAAIEADLGRIVLPLV